MTINEMIKALKDINYEHYTLLPYLNEKEITRIYDIHFNKNDENYFEKRVDRIVKKNENTVFKDNKYNPLQLREINLCNKKNTLLKYINQEFNWQQIREIRLGIEQNVDVSKYNNSNYNYSLMKIFRLALNEGVNIDKFLNLNLNERQLNDLIFFYKRYEFFCLDLIEEGYSRNQIMEIYLGLVSMLDIEKYCFPNLNSLQIREIRLALEQDIDISSFKDLNHYDMKNKRVQLLEEKIKNLYNKYNLKYEKLPLENLDFIGICIAEGLDVYYMLNKDFDIAQLDEIKLGLLYNVNVAVYANPTIRSYAMNLIKNDLREKKYIQEKYFDTDLDLNLFIKPEFKKEIF